MDKGSSRNDGSRPGRLARAILFALIAAAAVAMLGVVPASAQTPAAIDQYVETPPNNLGNPGGANGGNPKGDPNGGSPAQAADPAAPPLVVPGSPADIAQKLSKDPEPSSVEQGGAAV